MVDWLGTVACTPQHSTSTTHAPTGASALELLCELAAHLNEHAGARKRPRPPPPAHSSRAPRQQQHVSHMNRATGAVRCCGNAALATEHCDGAHALLLQRSATSAWPPAHRRARTTGLRCGGGGGSSRSRVVMRSRLMANKSPGFKSRRCTLCATPAGGKTGRTGGELPSPASQAVGTASGLEKA